ncbi:MAG: rhodanese-like domain-containing protein [Thiolinea sp.]
MNEYMLFVQNHSLLVMGFVGVLGLIIWTEFNRMTRKHQQADVTQAVRLMNNDDSVVLDVREDNEVRDGKIQGAKHIPLGQLDKRIAELEKSKDKPILVYCRSGNRSSHACATLTKNGFANVTNLAGGFMAWQSANLPVVKR